MSGKATFCNQLQADTLISGTILLLNPCIPRRSRVQRLILRGNLWERMEAAVSFVNITIKKSEQQSIAKSVYRDRAEPSWFCWLEERTLMCELEERTLKCEGTWRHILEEWRDYTWPGQDYQISSKSEQSRWGRESTSHPQETMLPPTFRSTFHKSSKHFVCLRSSSRSKSLGESIKLQHLNSCFYTLILH